MTMHLVAGDHATVVVPAVVTLTVPGQELRLRGRLDVHTVPDVRAALHDAVDGGTGDLVVEVSGVVVADATGLGVVVGAHRRAQRSGRRLILRDVPLPMLRLLRATRLHRVLHLDHALAGGSPADEDGPEGRAQVLRERLLRAQNRRASTSSMPRKVS